MNQWVSVPASPSREREGGIARMVSRARLAKKAPGEGTRPTTKTPDQENRPTKGNMEAIKESGDAPTMLPYQQKWLEDTNRFKIGLWARQTGKDFTCAKEAVSDCLAHPKNTWIIIACGERQARESLEKAKQWAEWLSKEEPQVSEKKSGREARMKSGEIRFSNGSRIIALPAKPQTIRGYSANLILTEFAFHEDPEGIWRAVFPMISNPLTGGEKKVRIISTPNGIGNKFHELWMGGKFFRQKVTIQDAFDAGLQINQEELKAGLSDPEGWAQEYECEFMDTSSVLLPYELIESCEDENATEHSSVEMFSRFGPELYVGIDFGRKRDLTVCWTFERVAQTLWTREALTLEKMATPEQLEILRPRLKRARKVCLDFTGAGVGLGDYLVKEFGEWNPMSHAAGRVELCQFTGALKCEIFPRLRAAMEKREVRIPVSRAIREDLHGIHRVVSQSGNVTYRASYSADGHSDRCTALALALRAAAGEPIVSGATVVKGENVRAMKTIRTRGIRV
jgi:phage FluMu gp28-like protein